MRGEWFWADTVIRLATLQGGGIDRDTRAGYESLSFSFFLSFFFFFSFLCFFFFFFSPSSCGLDISIGVGADADSSECFLCGAVKGKQ